MSFSYQKPHLLPEALALLAANPSALPVLAGGTDLIVQWRSGAIRPAGFIDISGLSELRAIEEKENAVEVGALATHAAILSHPAILAYCPVIAQACRTIGAAQIQNRGTIGGNVMNGSPAGDTLPVLAALGAKLLAQNLRGERWIPMGEFFTGYRRTALAPDELLARVRLPKMAKGEGARFLKIGARRAQAISKVSLCVRASIDHGGIGAIAIAVGSAAPTVVRAPGTEALLTGRAITAALIDLARRSLEDEIHPIDDVRSTAGYRRHAAGALLARFLKEA